MSEGMEDRRAEWQMILAEMDLNGDGTLSRDEILVAMCRSGQNPTDEEINSMFGEGALDDDKLTFEEYFAFMETMPDPADSLREAIEFFEHESEDGTISKERLKDLLMKELSEEEATELLDAADENGNGVIDKEEFIKLILNKE